VIYDLNQAARKHCPEALEIVLRCLRSDDECVALLAAQILFERAYGKPVQHSDVEVDHRFVVAPQTMALDRWLANKGSLSQRRRIIPSRRRMMTIPIGSSTKNIRHF
jgi:hypothetical protein